MSDNPKTTIEMTLELRCDCINAMQAAADRRGWTLPQFVSWLIEDHYDFQKIARAVKTDLAAKQQSSDDGEGIN